MTEKLKMIKRENEEKKNKGLVLRKGKRGVKKKFENSEYSI